MSGENQPTVALHTLGCRLNQYETESIREQFVADGYRVVPFSDVADVYVVNTCTVTGQADYQARQALRRAIRQAPDAFIVATGCYAQTDAQALLKVEGVDLVLGNAEKADLVRHVARARPLAEPSVYVSKRTALATFDDRLDVHNFSEHTRALLKIQDGCDQFCSFCIIPWARGRHRSRQFDSIVRELALFRGAGFNEVTLTGVHLGEYGSDLNPPSSLTAIVDEILKQSDPCRLRLSSIWPTAVTPGLVDLMARHQPRFCRYLHLALQHADDEILNAMRRTYSVEETTAVVQNVVREIPGICLGADIMTGFPGETDAHFNRMFNWLEAAPLAYLHVFAYSPRKHTHAAALPGQVSTAASKERSRILRELSDRKTRAFHEGFMGQDVEVLVETTRDSGRLAGLTDNYIRVEFDGPKLPSNTLAWVRLFDADHRSAYGVIVEN